MIKFGDGKLINVNGNVVEGEWIVQYKGELENDEQQGKGVKIWPDGSVYDWESNMGKNKEREHLNFMRLYIHGYGVYIWADGKEYNGQWLNRKMNGFGTTTWANGKKYIGNFKDDQKSGYGKFHWPNGSIYIGNMVNNMEQMDNWKSKYGYGRMEKQQSEFDQQTF